MWPADVLWMIDKCFKDCTILHFKGQNTSEYWFQFPCGDASLFWVPNFSGEAGTTQLVYTMQFSKDSSGLSLPAPLLHQLHGLGNLSICGTWFRACEKEIGMFGEMIQKIISFKRKKKDNFDLICYLQKEKETWRIWNVVMLMIMEFRLGWKNK